MEGENEGGHEPIYSTRKWRLQIILKSVANLVVIALRQNLELPVSIIIFSKVSVLVKDIWCS